MTIQSLLHPEGPLSLALAVVASSSAPLLLLDGGLSVVAASTSFCEAFGLEPAQVRGRMLAELGSGEWGGRQLESLLAATASGLAEVDSYEMDMVRAGKGSRRLIINAHRLDYDETSVRLLVAIQDVTDARLAQQLQDDLLREKAVQLQEVQHRVANSLQIIASVLMQSARKVVSDETRGHLKNAHNRVMSIAAVQRQLVASGLDEVKLSGYLTQLCQSLSASMIADPRQMTITVNVDDSVMDADISVSVGLIVTELVINSLKHAFPKTAAGKITVAFHRSHGEGWTLTVADDGIGMPKDSSVGRPGLGTGIVDALAKQLGATVVVADAYPGTLVTIRAHASADARSGTQVAQASAHRPSIASAD